LYFFAILSILDLGPGVALPGRGSSQSHCLQAVRVTRPLALLFDNPWVTPDSLCADVMPGAPEGKCPFR
jgi:hypothetical protein